MTARQAGITQQLYAVSAQGSSIRRLTHGTANHGRPVVSPDGRWLACRVEAPNRLPEVWLIATDGSRAYPVTRASRQLQALPDFRPGVPELVRWRSRSGLELQGLLLYPPEYGPNRKPKKPLPTIVDVHGGPTNQFPSLHLGDHPLYLTGLHHLAAQARTPTLHIYGEESIYTRHRQGESFRAALAAAGADVELVLLPKEGHFFVRDENQVELLRRTLAWLQRYIPAQLTRQIRPPPLSATGRAPSRATSMPMAGAAGCAGNPVVAVLTALTPPRYT